MDERGVGKPVGFAEAQYDESHEEHSQCFGLWDRELANSGLNSMQVDRTKVIRYRMTATTKSFVNPKFSIMKPPTAGPTIPAREGIIEPNKLTVLARFLDSLSLS